MFVDLFADKGLIVILLIAVLAGIYWVVKTRPNLQQLAPYVVMAGLTSLVFGKIISLLPIQTARPFVEKGVEAGAAFIDNPGFPSDHALLATVVVLAVYFLTPFRKLSYGLMALVVLMCAARVMALVHTPLDIVGGILAGVSGTVWYLKHKQDILSHS